MADGALLLMDLQQAIVDRFTEDTGYLVRLGEAADAARAAGLPVVHVTVGFRAGHPEVDPRNPVFGAMTGGARFTPGDPGAAIHPLVAPRDGEVVVAKKRVSAFAGSDLEMVLRASGVRHLVLAGVATSGVVLSTVRQAADLDFTLTVLRDGCLDADPEVHRVLTEKVFPRQAEVAGTREWIEALRG